MSWIDGLNRWAKQIRCWSLIYYSLFSLAGRVPQISRFLHRKTTQGLSVCWDFSQPQTGLDLPFVLISSISNLWREQVSHSFNSNEETWVSTAREQVWRKFILFYFMILLEWSWRVWKGFSSQAQTQEGPVKDRSISRYSVNVTPVSSSLLLFRYYRDWLSFVNFLF